MSCRARSATGAIKMLSLKFGPTWDGAFGVLSGLSSTCSAVAVSVGGRDSLEAWMGFCVWKWTYGLQISSNQPQRNGVAQRVVKSRIPRHLTYYLKYRNLMQPTVPTYNHCLFSCWAFVTNHSWYLQPATTAGGGHSTASAQVRRGICWPCQSSWNRQPNIYFTMCLQDIIETIITSSCNHCHPRSRPNCRHRYSK